MTPTMAYRLGIDFGTTHTVAVLETPDGRAQPLLFDSSPLLSSAVYADTDGRLLTGRDGERSARLDPTRYEPNPKRRIDEAAILLGSDEYPVPRVIAAVLSRVAAEAIRAAGTTPAQTVLTYPAMWGTRRKDLLVEAASAAGLGAVTVVPEPVAAAAHFTGVLGRTVNPGEALAVYDFGAGTFDASVVRRRPDDGGARGWRSPLATAGADGNWELVASDGLTDVGGLDLDAVLVERIGRSLAPRDPQRWYQLTNPAFGGDPRATRTFWEDVRAAKEQLSRTASAAVHVPLFDTDTHLTREEFEAAARPLLARTVEVMAALLNRVGPTPLAGLYLVGGSSRIPLIATMLHQRLGVAPTLIDQPELLVAQGSLRAAPPPAGAPGTPPFGVTMPGAPLGAPAPMSAMPMSGIPMSGAPVSGSPVSTPPFGAAPVSVPPGGDQGYGSPPPMPPAGTPLWGSTVAPAPPPGGPGSPARRSGRLKWVLAAAAAVVLIVGCLGVGRVGMNLLGGDDDADPGTTTGQRRDAGEEPGVGDAAGGVPQAGGGPRQQHDIKRTVWYGGKKITLGMATYEPAVDPPLQIEVTVENLAAEQDYTINGMDINFSVDGQSTKGRVAEISTLPASQTVKGRFTFEPDKPITNLKAGVLTIGDDKAEPVVAPLNDPGKTVSLEPKKVAGPASVTVKELQFTIKVCDLRGDIPSEHKQVPKNSRSVVCTFDVKLNHPPGVYNHVILKTNFVLRLPDNTVVAPEEFDNILLEPQEQKLDAIVGFVIRWPAPGSYALQVHDAGRFGNDPANAGNRGEVPMTLS